MAKFSGLNIPSTESLSEVSDLKKPLFRSTSSPLAGIEDTHQLVHLFLVFSCRNCFKFDGCPESLLIEKEAGYAKKTLSAENKPDYTLAIGFFARYIPTTISPRPTMRAVVAGVFGAFKNPW